MKEWLKRRIKKTCENIESTLTQIFFLALFGGSVAILAFSKNALNFVLQLLNTSTPLWAAISLILLCGLYTGLKIRRYQKSYKPPNVQEELREEFGVYWNNKYKLRCLKCKWPLKCSSDRKDPSLFFCSNCNLKHSIRDKNGKHLTEAQAIEQLKSCQPVNPADRQ